MTRTIWLAGLLAAGMLGYGTGRLGRPANPAPGPAAVDFQATIRISRWPAGGGDPANPDSTPARHSLAPVRVLVGDRLVFYREGDPARARDLWRIDLDDGRVRIFAQPQPAE